MDDKGAKKQPDAPDPRMVAGAQQQANFASLMNYRGPFGSVSYDFPTGAPDYDLNAYDAAMSAYKTGGGGGGGSPAYYFGEDYGGGAAPAGTGGGGRGAPPSLEDFRMGGGFGGGNPTQVMSLDPDVEAYMRGTLARSTENLGYARDAAARVALPWEPPGVTRPELGDLELPSRPNWGELPEVRSDYTGLRQEATDRVFDYYDRSLSPEWARREEAAIQRYANRGLPEGGEAYRDLYETQVSTPRGLDYANARDRAYMSGLGEAGWANQLERGAYGRKLGEMTRDYGYDVDAYNRALQQLSLNYGYDVDAYNRSGAERNDAYRQLGAFTNTPQPSFIPPQSPRPTQPVPVGDYIYNDYAADYNQWAADEEARSGLWGTLGTVGGGIAGGFFGGPAGAMAGASMGGSLGGGMSRGGGFGGLPSGWLMPQSGGDYYGNNQWTNPDWLYPQAVQSTGGYNPYIWPGV